MPTKRGFTLIEILIATAIFAIVALSLYAAYQTGISSYRKIDATLNLYRAAGITFSRIESGLKNAVIYSVDDSGFSGDKTSLDFLAALNVFDRDLGFSKRLCRLNYSFGQDGLALTTYYGEDAFKEGANGQLGRLASGIKEVSFQFYPALKPEEGSQPAPIANWPQDEKDKSLPIAVEIKLLISGNDNQAPIEFKKIVALPLSYVNDNATP